MDIDLSDVRASERQLIASFSRFLFKGLFNKNIRKTKHFNEWYSLPMNYARIMEIPITKHTLGARKEHAILDISSPKSLSLYYMLNGFHDITITDVDSYFIDDFKIYKNEIGNTSAELLTFDATRQFPFHDNSFDRIFSVSVIEHFPKGGDSAAIKEIARVLKPGGVAVVTLPAYFTYMEEWTSNKLPWPTEVNEAGRDFFQRRYDRKEIDRLLSGSGLHSDYILVAETPIAPISVGSDGILKHNSYLVYDSLTSKVIRRLGRHLKLPYARWLAERCASARHHYLTTEWDNPEIRQVVLRLEKQ